MNRSVSRGNICFLFFLQLCQKHDLRTECCRFETESDNTKIAKGINLAESLKELNLSYNGITADTAFALLSSINGNRAKLQTLRLDNVWVKPEFHKVGPNTGLDVATLSNLLLHKIIKYGVPYKEFDLSILIFHSNDSKKHVVLLQLSQELQSQNGMRVLVQGVIGGVDIKGPDMQTLLLKRANFLGYKPKSKKNKKDFGYCI